MGTALFLWVEDLTAGSMKFLQRVPASWQTDAAALPESRMADAATEREAEAAEPDAVQGTGSGRYSYQQQPDAKFLEHAGHEALIPFELE